MAIAFVGGFAFVMDLVRVGQVPLLTGDPDAARLARRLNLDLMVSIAKVVTTLGTFPVCATVALVTAVVLVRRGQRAAAGVLVVGFALSWIAVQVTKAATDRARPTGALVATHGSSFPSGHAANAVIWAAAAVMLAQALRGRTGEAGLVVAGVVVTVLIGLSRVYLRAHYLSDVVAGWGLASAIYALCGIAALLVGHMRNNRRATA